MNQEDLKNMSPQEVLELQKKNCIFCKIISKEIPSYEIYSDEKVVVILDINPGNEGHCLILPKEHFQILPQIPDELIGHLFTTAKNISRSLLKALSVSGTTTFVANGAIAGQKAPHFMVHVLPRKQGDMLFEIPKKNAEESELEAMKDKLSSHLGGQPKQLEHKDVEKQKINNSNSMGFNLDEISDAILKAPKPQGDSQDNKNSEAETSQKMDTEIKEEVDTSVKEEEVDIKQEKQKKNDMNLDDIAGMFTK